MQTKTIAVMTGDGYLLVENVKVDETTDLEVEAAKVCDRYGADFSSCQWQEITNIEISLTN